jgi:hypothetical protein
VAGALAPSSRPAPLGSLGREASEAAAETQADSGQMMIGTMVILASGYVKIAIENCHRNSEFSH